MLNWWIDLFKLAFVRHITIPRVIFDVGAGDGSISEAIAVGDALGPKALTEIRVLTTNGYTTDGTDYFTATVTTVDPETGLARDSATASFTNKNVGAGMWGTVALSAPLTVKRGDLVNVAIGKQGAGVLLNRGIIQLR